jgi:hypothetical protein
LYSGPEIVKNPELQRSDLPRRRRREIEQAAKQTPVHPDVGVLGDIQLGDEIAPAQQLSEQAPFAVGANREIRKPQHARVAVLAAPTVIVSQEFPGSIHFVGNHKDLLVQRKSRPPFGR